MPGAIRAAEKLGDAAVMWKASRLNQLTVTVPDVATETLLLALKKRNS